MPKKKGGSKIPTKRGVPGAVGGPGTARGVNYQVEYAVVKSLDLISRSLCAPLKSRVIRMEPRVANAGGATQWDLGIEPPDTLIEAKCNPTRGDILDWVDRLKTAAATPDGRYTLVYARGGGTLLPSMEKLLRNAREAAGDATKFASLLAMETIAESTLLLTRLGSDPHQTLLHGKIECYPEPGLADDIEMRATFLVGERQAQRLIDFLFRQFSQGMAQRRVFPVRDLIAEIQSQGMTLNAPPKVDPVDLPAPALAAIAIL